MSWNYRAVVEHCGDEDVYTLREVYYDAAGNINGWSPSPAEPHGDSLDELRADLERMRAALDKPALEEDGNRLVLA